MDLLSSIFIFGGILTVSSGLVIAVMLSHNPRLMLRSYPKAIKLLVDPPSATEKNQTMIGGILFWLLLLGLPLLSTLLLKKNLHGDIPFGVAFANSLGVLSVSNVADWLLFDWLIGCTITPRFMVIPGTEGHPAYKDYMFHFVAFLRGIVITSIVSLLVAVLASIA